MDRNLSISNQGRVGAASLSARRAWIEIDGFGVILTAVGSSLSARRAWIEIKSGLQPLIASLSRSPQGERG